MTNFTIEAPYAHPIFGPFTIDQLPIWEYMQTSTAPLSASSFMLVIDAFGPSARTFTSTKSGFYVCINSVTHTTLARKGVLY